MQHEKIIKREDGTEVMIRVRVGAASIRHNVFVKKIGEQEFKWRFETIDNATPFEILSAKLELWEKLKPTI